MDVKEFILDLYKKGYTPKYIANLIYKKMKKRNSALTEKQALNIVEGVILDFYSTQRT